MRMSEQLDGKDEAERRRSKARVEAGAEAELEAHVRVVVLGDALDARAQEAFHAGSVVAQRCLAVDFRADDERPALVRAERLPNADGAAEDEFGPFVLGAKVQT